MLTERTAVCLLCLTALMPLTVTPQRCSQDGYNYIQKIRNKPPDWASDTRLYTPTLQDFQKCPSATLTCLKAEVDVLCDEWSVEKKIVKSLTRILATQAQSLQKVSQAESGCSNCENFQEQNATVFLDFLSNTVQNINSMSCTQ